MILHKLLRGGAAGTYLPFALSRLRWLEKIHGPKGFFDQKFFIENYTIRVQQAPPFQYLYIEETGGINYEFFTSEHVSDQTLASPGHSHDIAHSYVCGSATRATFDSRGKVLHARPRYSSSLVGEAWPELNCEAAQTTDTRLLTWRSWQNQKFFEYAWHPHNNGKSLVTSTIAQPPGWGNRMGMYSPYCTARFGNLNSFVSDIGLDVAPTLYTAAGTVSAAPFLEHGWLYWRRAAVHSASGRSFFISTDNYGRFHIYPVKDYGSEKFSVPPSKYKRYTPPYPAWVTVPAASDFTQQHGQWLWRFNKDATKCVTVAYNSTDTSFVKYLNNQSFFCVLLPEDTATVTPPVALAPAHEDRPGLVEFGIDIALTGDGDMDFDVTFSVLRTSYFEDDGRFFFDAAYFMKDVEDTGIPEDTLMTAEIECKTPPAYYTAGPTSNAWATDAVDACRMMYGEVVVNANSAGLVRTELVRFPAIGPAWLQYPTITGVRNGDNEGWGLATQTIPTTLGSMIAIPAGPIGYDPDGHIVPGRIWSGPLNVGVKYGFLYALELSTLSMFYEVDDEVAGTFEMHAIAYGQEFYSYTGDLGYTLPAPFVLPAEDPVPSFRPHQTVLNFVMNTSFGDGFSVHPAGHWAFNLGGYRNADLPLESDLDWISVYKGKDKDGNVLRERHRHKDLFNRAFTQTRDYSFYHEPFAEEALGDFGSFRTAGFWVTFR